MEFRERDEYKQWRAAVFDMFGQSCLLCGHAGNLHVHHVFPVSAYPELALDPSNGAPLCGNCHAEVNGHESDFAEILQQRQCEVRGGPSRARVGDLRRAAESSPSDAEAVVAWLKSEVEPGRAVDFWRRNKSVIPRNSVTCGLMAFQLYKLKRYADATKFGQASLKLAEKEGTLELRIQDTAWAVAASLKESGLRGDARAFVEPLLARFPKNGELHSLIAVYGFDPLATPGDRGPYLCHCLAAANLCPDRFEYALGACVALQMANPGDHSTRFKHARQALKLARTTEERLDSLRELAAVHQDAGLFRDAIQSYEEALELSEDNSDILANMAHCYVMQDRSREAEEFARRALLVDPENRLAQTMLESALRARDDG